MNKPIRILHVFGKLHRGGAETMVMNLYRHIDRSKIQFDFVVHNESIEAYEAEIIELGGIIHRVPKYKGFNHIKYVKAWEKLISSHREYKIIHGHVRSTAIIYLGVCNKHDRTTIIHSHSISNGKGLSALVKKILQYPIRFNSNYFFSPSIKAGKWLFGEKITKNNNFYILKNAIDVSKFKYNENIRKKVREDLGLKEKFIIGHVGRFHTSKNHDFLLEIFYEIHLLNFETKLLLLGDGEEFKRIKSKTEKMGLNNHVIFKGSTSQTPELMQAMDIFVFPSYYEGLGIVAIESQAAGLPTIISENIPEEAYLTNLVKKVNLDEGSEIWAQEILKYNNAFVRKDSSELIKKYGYDIADNAKWLEEFYRRIS